MGPSSLRDCSGDMSGATSAWHEWVPRLNPEGDQVIYTSSAQGEVGTKMMAVPFEGGAPRAILQDTLIDNNQCARSPSHVCVYSTTIGKKETFYQFDEKHRENEISVRGCL
jgi:hypothetical protein